MAVTTLQIPAKPRAARRPRPPGYASQMAFVATGLDPDPGPLRHLRLCPGRHRALAEPAQIQPAGAGGARSSALRNFEFAFTNDALFINALIVTLKYALVAVPLNLIIALPIAMGLNQVTRLRAVFRSAFFLPTVASAVAVSLIWRYIYEPQTGVLNAVLAALGLAATLLAGRSGHRALGDPDHRRLAGSGLQHSHPAGRVADDP